MWNRSGRTRSGSAPAVAGDNVRPAGEDLATGQVALQAGRRLTPADLGLVASLGIGEITVHRRLRVAFFSTGDELRSIGEPLVPGAVYDSNRYTLYGVLTRLGAEAIDMGVVPDVPDAVASAFEEAGGCADVLITSGGASVGEADFILDTLGAVGRVAFWNVATKPGRPIAFGRVGGAVFFGLPGNPVSVMATYYQFVQPALRRMAGESSWRPLVVQARCTKPLKKKPGRVEYQRGVLDRDAQGALLVPADRAPGLRHPALHERGRLLHRPAPRLGPGRARHPGRCPAVLRAGVNITRSFSFERAVDLTSYSDPSARARATWRSSPSVQIRSCQGLQQTSQS